MEVLLCFGLPAENEHVDFSCPQKFIAYPQPHEILKCLIDNRPFNFRIFALINDPSPPLAIAMQPLREFDSPLASHRGAPSFSSVLLFFFVWSSTVSICTYEYVLSTTCRLLLILFSYRISESSLPILLSLN